MALIEVPPDTTPTLYDVRAGTLMAAMAAIALPMACIVFGTLPKSCQLCPPGPAKEYSYRQIPHRLQKHIRSAMTLHRNHGIDVVVGLQKMSDAPRIALSLLAHRASPTPAWPPASTPQMQSPARGKAHSPTPPCHPQCRDKTKNRPSPVTTKGTSSANTVSKCPSTSTFGRACEPWTYPNTFPISSMTQSLAPYLAIRSKNMGERLSASLNGAPCTTTKLLQLLKPRRLVPLQIIQRLANPRIPHQRIHDTAQPGRMIVTLHDIPFALVNIEKESLPQRNTPPALCRAPARLHRLIQQHWPLVFAAKV